MEKLISHDRGSANYNFKWNLSTRSCFPAIFLPTGKGSTVSQGQVFLMNPFWRNGAGDLRTALFARTPAAGTLAVIAITSGIHPVKTKRVI